VTLGIPDSAHQIAVQAGKVVKFTLRPFLSCLSRRGIMVDKRIRPRIDRNILNEYPVNLLKTFVAIAHQKGDKGRFLSGDL
jgi:hypothetical protein